MPRPALKRLKLGQPLGMGPGNMRAWVLAGPNEGRCVLWLGESLAESVRLFLDEHARTESR